MYCSYFECNLFQNVIMIAVIVRLTSLINSIYTHHENISSFIIIIIFQTVY